MKKVPNIEVLKGLYAPLLPMTDDELIDLWKYDNNLIDNDEAQELTNKAKENKTTIRERESVTNNNNKLKERKVDNEKAMLLSNIARGLQRINVNITEIKTETQISFEYNNNKYSVKLTKHRK